MDNTILLGFQSIAALLGWTILHSIWKITIIALVLKLLLLWTSKYDATIRYALSISALFVATFWSINTFLETFNNIQLIEKSAINIPSESSANSVFFVENIATSPIS